MNWIFLIEPSGRDGSHYLPILPHRMFINYAAACGLGLEESKQSPTEGKHESRKRNQRERLRLFNI